MGVLFSKKKKSPACRKSSSLFAFAIEQPTYSGILEGPQVPSKNFATNLLSVIPSSTRWCHPYQPLMLGFVVQWGEETV
jgi:hypothetical protein